MTCSVGGGNASVGAAGGGGGGSGNSQGAIALTYWMTAKPSSRPTKNPMIGEMLRAMLPNHGYTAAGAEIANYNW